MKNIKPFSALYFMRENRGKAFICIFMMFLGTFIFLAGNYVASEFYTAKKCEEYSEKLVVVGITMNDTDCADFSKFEKLVSEDEKLEYVPSSAYGFGGMQYMTVLGLRLGGFSYVFNSVEDMERVFNRLGIESDLSNCTDRNIVICEELARDKGLKVGDKVDKAFDGVFDFEYTVGAIIDDSSFCTFYIFNHDDNIGRLYVFSDYMEGTELYDYVENLADGLEVQVSGPSGPEIDKQFSVFVVLFYLIVIIIAIVLAVTINSVITGQYMKRTYEFAIYNAIGVNRKRVKHKVACEVLVMNAVATLIGFVIVLLFTYLMNELVYVPKGQYLVYCSEIGLKGFAICEVLTLIPVILSKGRKMSMADVTEF